MGRASGCATDKEEKDRGEWCEVGVGASFSFWVLCVGSRMRKELVTWSGGGKGTF